MAVGRFQKVVFLIIFIILITSMIFTQSRGAILGLAVSGLIWGIWGRIAVRKLLLGIIILCLVVFIVVLAADVSSNDMLAWLYALDAESKEGNVAATSWLTRVEIWQVGGQLLSEYPVIGSGLYTFDPVSRANYVYETILPSFNLTHAHNLFLQTGSSLGIGGLLALLGIWLVVLIRLWQSGDTNNEQIRQLAAVFAASIVGFLFFNLFDTITFGQKPGPFVWIVLAGSFGVSQLAKKGAATSQPSSDVQGRLTFPRLLSFAPYLALVILLLSPAMPKNLANLRLDQAYLQLHPEPYVNTADFEDDIRRTGLVYHLQGEEVLALAAWQQDPQSVNYLHSQGTIAFMAGSLHQAISWYDLALSLDPLSAETYLWRGIANEERGTIDLAEADFSKAAEYSAESDTSRSTKAFIYYRLGNLLARKGKWQTAAEAFSQATVFEPEQGWYYRALGDALAVLGDEQGAATAYQKADR
jgi:Flp pilus assembly protein TadD